MDLRGYYQKIRETESALTEVFVVLVSCETPDGGKGGVCTEVPRSLAAKMVVDGTARRATAEEARVFRKTLADAKRAFDEAEAAKVVQFKVVNAEDLRKVAGGRSTQERN